MSQIAPSTPVFQLTVDQFEELLLRAAADREPPADVVDQTGAAQFLNVSIPTLRKLVAEGLPHVMVGEHRRFAKSEIWAWLKARSRSPEAAE